MVLLAHIIRGVLIAADPTLRRWYLLFPTDGDFAVYVLFVVSGFALACGYLETGNIRFLTSLAIKRYPRLMLPVLASSLIGFVLVDLGLTFNHEAAVVVRSPWLDFAFTLSVSLFNCLKFALFDVFFAYDPQRAYNGVLWTMSIELYGSMLVCCVLALFGKESRWIAYVACALVCALLNSPLLAFIFGMMLAELYHWRGRTLLDVAAPYFLVLVVGSCIVASIYTPYPRDPRFLSVLEGLLVLAISLYASARRFFGVRLSRFLGSISFPLYLTHMFVILSFTSWSIVELNSRGVDKRVAAICIILTTIPLSILGAVAFLPVEAASVRVARRFADACLVQRKVCGETQF
ncbi:acyltransferase [Burkholderia sp. SIMBA_043]|uniref:acyltransferase family protein n=2 Tax=Burkholderiaceae TaxID=119060 RepID=UPI0005D7D81A|nr:acyltransferase [Burkholderia vietnamiensis]AJY06599.1 acyltransferase family protein [Burkholderia vietnamiensis LMG 10929]UBI26642.1 acyltransferase [Burkholderia vietnamiensis]